MLGCHDDTKMWARQDPQSQASWITGILQGACYPGGTAHSAHSEPPETHNPENRWQGQK